MRQAIVLMLLIVPGCATHKTITPTISEPPRNSLVVKTPILVSLLDARTDKASTERVMMSLREGLSETYRDSLEWCDYFDRVPKGRVAVRIRLMAAEADFGARLVVTSAFGTTYGSASASVSDGWHRVIATGSSEQTLFGGSFTGEGWWIGTAWIELDIHDHRREPPEFFTLPIVAECRESNMWGYRSANKAAKRAWARVRQGLIRVIDSVLVTVRDQES